MHFGMIYDVLVIQVSRSRDQKVTRRSRAIIMFFFLSIIALWYEILIVQSIQK